MLKDQRVAPQGDATATGLMIFLHGYGADGNDLLGLADVLAEHLPGVAFRAPDGPEACYSSALGRQWFSLPWLDGSDPLESGRALAQSDQMLQAYVQTCAKAEGVPLGRTLLFGFSQGTMMALRSGPQLPEALAGIIGFSGRLLPGGAITTRPPVLLLHGDQDPVVPFGDLAAAKSGLEAAGLTVETCVMKGTAHGISQPGLVRALDFMRRHLA